MATIKTYPMQNSAILRLNAEKEEINTSPEYQREGDIWTKEKKQLLVDSVLNDFDIPKIYFHALPSNQKEEQGNKFTYAIIDGRQRLEAIWGFVKGDFALAADFSFLEESDIEAGGMTYGDLAKHYPKLKIRFDSFNLPIVIIEAENMDLIEDMFSRLNEAVPLNAAEKRNAIGGEMATVIREVSSHSFFATKVSFKNTRYQHMEVAAKLLFIEESIRDQQRIIDTKKPYLDDMVIRCKQGNSKKINELKENVILVLNFLLGIFEDSDSLLRTQTPVPIYYLVAKDVIRAKEDEKLSRQRLIQFYQDLRENRQIAENDIAKANYEMLEYDRMTQQGSNDSISIRERVRILEEYLKIISSLRNTRES